MKRAILFRFHKNFPVCLNRLQTLHKLNPNLAIYGEGEEANHSTAEKALGRELESLHYIKGKSRHWKWFHGDLCVRKWFIDYGHRMDFDMLHVIEWDMLFFESLEKLYRKIPNGGMGLTGLRLLKPVQSRWDWTSKEPYKTRWLKLLETVRKKYGYDMEPYGCVGPGPYLPREFLERYSKIKPYELVNDELNYPLFAQIFGIKLYDTGFFRWFNDYWYKFFNSEGIEIKDSNILSELNRKGGRRFFHPYYKTSYPNTNSEHVKI